MYVVEIKYNLGTKQINTLQLRPKQKKVNILSCAPNNNPQSTFNTWLGPCLSQLKCSFEYSIRYSTVPFRK